MTPIKLIFYKYNFNQKYTSGFLKLRAEFILERGLSRFRFLKSSKDHHFTRPATEGLTRACYTNLAPCAALLFSILSQWNSLKNFNFNFEFDFFKKIVDIDLWKFFFLSGEKIRGTLPHEIFDSFFQFSLAYSRNCWQKFNSKLELLVFCKFSLRCFERFNLSNDDHRMLQFNLSY